MDPVNRVLNQLGVGAQRQFRSNMFFVGFDGFHADAQLFGNLSQVTAQSLSDTLIKTSIFAVGQQIERKIFNSASGAGYFLKKHFVEFFADVCGLSLQHLSYRGNQFFAAFSFRGDVAIGSGAQRRVLTYKDSLCIDRIKMRVFGISDRIFFVRSIPLNPTSPISTRIKSGFRLLILSSASAASVASPHTSRSLSCSIIHVSPCRKTVWSSTKIYFVLWVWFRSLNREQTSHRRSALGPGTNSQRPVDDAAAVFH